MKEKKIDPKRKKKAKINLPLLQSMYSLGALILGVKANTPTAIRSVYMTSKDVVTFNINKDLFYLNDSDRSYEALTVN